MYHSLSNKKQGVILILGAIITGLLYQSLPIVISDLTLLEILGTFFNAVIMGIIAYIMLKTEFFEWFMHFSSKWLLVGIPTLIIVGTVSSIFWATISGGHTANSINGVLSWSYVIKNIPFMLLGEELLSISILYGAWKKWNWEFWQATLLCSILFAVWHLFSYDFNLLQCLVTIIPSRLVLNYLFKKSNSIWVTLTAHIVFDVFAFLPILLK